MRIFDVVIGLNLNIELVVLLHPFHEPFHEEIENAGPLLRWVWRHLGKYVKSCRSFEDWELGFLRDVHPEKEIALWVRATYAYLQFVHENPANANRDGVFNAVFHLMNGREDLVKPKSAAKRLQKLMRRGFPQKLFEIDNFTEDGHLKTGDKHLQ